MSKTISWVLFLSFLGFDVLARPADNETIYSGSPQWSEFRAYMEAEKNEKEKRGLAFMISGAIAGVGGAVAAERSTEIFSRTVFTVASNVGFAAIGWGALAYWTGSERDSFYAAIDNSSLSLAQKNEVLQKYLTREKQEQESRRWIRVATHALLAAVNVYGASREDNSEIRSLYYFLGGANAVLAVSYSF